MKKRITSLLLALVIAASVCGVAFAAEENEPAAAPRTDSAGELSFENIADAMKKKGLAVLAIEESIAQLECIDYKKLQNELNANLFDVLVTQTDLTKLINGVRGSIDAIAASSLGAEAGAGASAAINGYIAASSAASVAGLQAQYDAYEDAVDDIIEGKLQADNQLIIDQLRSMENQTIFGAQTLYITLIKLEITEAALKRTVASLERTVEELSLRYELGQISELTLLQTKAGLESARSGLATLQVSLSAMRAQLELLTGMDVKGNLKTRPLPEVTKRQLSLIYYDGDLNTAKANSYELKAAKKAFDDAEETYKDACDEYKHNTSTYKYEQAIHAHNAAKYTYESTVTAFEMNFRNLYNELKDKAQVLSAAKTSFEAAEAAFAASELKYKQETISRNAYLSAQDELEDARDTVTTAKYDLYASWNEYRCAVDCGILS